MNTDAKPLPRTTQIHTLLNHIRTIAPTIGIVRVEDLGSTVGKPMAYLDRMPRRIKFFLLQGVFTENCSKQIRTFLSCSEEVARDLYDTLCSLVKLARSGAWLIADLEPAPAGDLLAGSFTGGSASHTFNNLILDLASDLPGISRILVDTASQSTTHGYMRRRTFLRFIAGENEEVCTIDTALVTPSIRVLAGFQDEQSKKNLFRAKHWAAQLDVKLSDLALLLHDLVLLTVVVPSGSIYLRSSEKADAHWRSRGLEAA